MSEDFFSSGASINPKRHYSHNDYISDIVDKIAKFFRSTVLTRSCVNIVVLFNLVILDSSY